MVSGLLEGKNLGLRVMEKEDLPLIAEWSSILKEEWKEPKMLTRTEKK